MSPAKSPFKIYAAKSPFKIYASSSPLPLHDSSNIFRHAYQSPLGFLFQFIAIADENNDDGKEMKLGTGTRWVDN